MILLFFLLSESLFSQNNKSDSLSSFEFKWSNDFEYQTDYYFTNGFAFEIAARWEKSNPTNSILIAHTSESKVLYSLTLLQNIYTPKAKFDLSDQLNGDRPFAAYILLGAKKISFNKTDRTKLYSEIQIGILGPAAFGEEVQNGIHSLLPTSSEVNGWGNQIANSLMLNYSVSAVKSFSIKRWFELSGIVSAKLGLPYTNARVGVRTRIGFFDVFPSEFEYYSSQDFKLFLSLGTDASIVGYNATLQGGLISKSIYTLNKINRFVGYANIGIILLFNRFELEYVQQFNTPEFPGAVYHSWGYLSIKVKL
jgi:lipid A 3-O-deacylase